MPDERGVPRPLEDVCGAAAKRRPEPTRPRRSTVIGADGCWARAGQRGLHPGGARDVIRRRLRRGTDRRIVAAERDLNDHVVWRTAGLGKVAREAGLPPGDADKAQIEGRRRPGRGDTNRGGVDAAGGHGVRAVTSWPASESGRWTSAAAGRLVGGDVRTTR